MKDFTDQVAVITGSGSGIGREIARQLATKGCHLALCDLFEDTLAETRKLCLEATNTNIRIVTQGCDVADENQVLEFRDRVAAHFGGKVSLLFNNAGIGGGGSIVDGNRREWDRVFAVCWGGVYHCTRAFIPLLTKASSAWLINISSVNGFWATLGPDTPHSAYSAAKFAVKGFTEALVTDLRMHAPHVRVAVVMPGHIGTSILLNSNRVLQEDLFSATDTAKHSDDADDAIALGFLHEQAVNFKENAPTTASEAAGVVLNGIQKGQWRILIGADARRIDEQVRKDPESAYEPEFFAQVQANGDIHLVEKRDLD